jgi:hypothetical protein
MRISIGLAADIEHWSDKIKLNDYHGIFTTATATNYQILSAASLKAQNQT